MNKAILCGRTTKDTEVSMTKGGKKVCSFTLAIDEGKDESGNRRTQFIDCEAWDKRASFMEAYVKKGMRILVEGRLNKRMYEKDGQKHYPVSVICDRIEFADGTNQSKDEGIPTATQNAPKTAQNRPVEDYGIPQNISIDSDDLPF